MMCSLWSDINVGDLDWNKRTRACLGQPSRRVGFLGKQLPMRPLYLVNLLLFNTFWRWFIDVSDLAHSQTGATVTFYNSSPAWLSTILQAEGLLQCLETDSAFCLLCFPRSSPLPNSSGHASCSWFWQCFVFKNPPDTEITVSFILSTIFRCQMSKRKNIYPVLCSLSILNSQWGKGPGLCDNSNIPEDCARKRRFRFLHCLRMILIDLCSI